MSRECVIIAACIVFYLTSAFRACCVLHPSQSSISFLPLVDATVNFTQTLYTGIESDMSVSVCASIEGNLAQDVVVSITTQSLTAQGMFRVLQCFYTLVCTS